MPVRATLLSARTGEGFRARLARRPDRRRPSGRLRRPPTPRPAARRGRTPAPRPPAPASSPPRSRGGLAFDAPLEDELAGHLLGGQLDEARVVAAGLPQGLEDLRLAAGLARGWYVLAHLLPLPSSSGFRSRLGFRGGSSGLRRRRQASLSSSALRCVSALRRSSSSGMTGVYGATGPGALRCGAWTGDWRRCAREVRVGLMGIGGRGGALGMMLRFGLTSRGGLVGIVFFLSVVAAASGGVRR